MLDRSSNVNIRQKDKPFHILAAQQRRHETRKRNIPLPHTSEGGFVTVCVAAIAGGNCIYGASDRMITSWTTGFEPGENEVKGEASPTPLKSISLTNSIVAMIAGDDISLLTQIIYDLKFIVSERIKNDKANWWTVSDVAHQYRALYSAKKNQIIESKILAPRGLTFDSFVGRQKDFDSSFLMRVDSEIRNFQFPSLSVIFAGIDPSGAHLYVVRNEEIACEDLLGFAAIGSGYWHAEYQFMATGHTRDAPLARGVYLTYAAKRRAEVAPGVGKGTDMFLIGPQLGSYSTVAPFVLRECNKIYESAQKNARKAWAKQGATMQAMLDRLVKEAEQKAQKAKGQEPPKRDDGEPSRA